MLFCELVWPILVYYALDLSAGGIPNITFLSEPTHRKKSS